MATILLRSPYYETQSDAYSSPNVAKSATLTLSVNGTQITQMSKDTVLSGTSGQETGTVSFEIADICRDYLDITFNNVYTGQFITIGGSIQFKSATVDEINTGSAVTNMTSYAISHIGIDGYYEFMEGLGTGQNSAKVITGTPIMQDNVNLYVPNDTAGQIPYWDGSTIVYQGFSSTATNANVTGTAVTINRACNKHTAYKVTFVNKYGAFEDLYFNGRTIESVNIKKTTFKRSIANSSMEYDKQKHSIKQYNTLANEKIILNSPPMSYDTVNESIKQLLVSEQVWIYKDSQITPINITDTQQQYKTGVGDKVIQYTITAEYAFDYISNIR
jgi:hypothetical protein